MRLEGIHHITAITGDAPRNLDFYTRVLGLRLAAKTVNQDDPSVYHLFYADEQGHAGSDITFFEYPGAPRGRTGPGMVHTIVWRVGGPEAIDFWEQRLGAEGVATEREGDVLRFSDPEGLGHELAVERDRRRAAVGRASRGPGRARAPGLRRRPRVQLQPRRDRRAPRASARRRAGRRRRVGAARRAPRRAVPPRPGAGGARAAGRGHRPPRRVRHDGGRPPAVVRAHPARRRAAPRRSSTATTSTRSTSASRAASSSRSPTTARASRSTCRSRSSARR